MTTEEIRRQQIAQLDALFGKPAQKKKASEALRKPKPAASASEEKAQRILDDNAKLALLTESMIWKPIAIVHHVITQECRLCGEQSEFIGGVFIQHQNTRTKTLWSYPRPFLPHFLSLPRTVIEAVQTVEMCPTCLRNPINQHLHGYNLSLLEDTNRMLEAQAAVHDEILVAANEVDEIDESDES